MTLLLLTKLFITKHKLKYVQEQDFSMKHGTQKSAVHMYRRYWRENWQDDSEVV